jgi:hypothetical protein
LSFLETIIISMINKTELKRLQSLDCRDILLIRMLLDSHNKQPATAFEKAFQEEVEELNTANKIFPVSEKSDKAFFSRSLNRFLLSWILNNN